MPALGNDFCVLGGGQASSAQYVYMCQVIWVCIVCVRSPGVCEYQKYRWVGLGSPQRRPCSTCPYLGR